MADNIAVLDGAGVSITLRSTESGGVHTPWHLEDATQRAALLAKFPGIGTAGTANANCITVQGIAGMTAVKVDGSAVTQPVSGTFWQATQPVSAASLPLPTGAAAAAKQPALGTAGTASSDVLSVQGIASMTPLQVDQTKIAGNSISTGNGASGTGVQRVTIASDSTGVVGLAAGSNTIGALTANQSVNCSQMNGVAVTMGNGVSGTGVQRVTIASDSTGVVGLAAGSNTIGALTANQTVDLNKVAGTSTATGNGTASAGCQRVTIASDNTPFTVNATPLDTEYETVAASQTDQVMGATGAANDYLAGVLVIPATTSPGAVSIKDGGGSAITIFTGGASSVSNLVPFFVPLGIKCATSWKITTGSNVSAIGVGNFT